MKHHIIVKFTPEVADKAALIGEVKALFAAEPMPDGVTSYDFFENCVARDNRFDLMIVVHLPQAALPAWDTSSVHKRWKSDFGQYVEKKAIFDCE